MRCRFTHRTGELGWCSPACGYNAFDIGAEPMTQPRTLFDKIWDSHVLAPQGEGTYLLYIDLHLCHEVTTPQAFEGLKLAGRKVRRPDATFAVADHNIPTSNRKAGIDEPESRLQVETLERNVVE